jgi:hypothetical protein
MISQNPDLYEGGDPQSFARQYPYKFYDPTRQTLLSARSNFNSLFAREHDDLNHCKPSQISSSQSGAEWKKQTIYNEGIYKTELCQHHPKTDNGDRVKTGLGWLPSCCAKQLDLPQLPCAPLKPVKTVDAVAKEYVDRRYELALIIGLKQYEVTQRSLATRAANKAEKERLENNAKKEAAREAESPRGSS